MTHAQKKFRGAVGAIAVMALGGAIHGTRSIAAGAREKSAAAQQAAFEGPPPAEKVYKNIQVLKGVPASQLIPTMNLIAASLGTNCAHCHIVNQFEKDDKPPKQTARRMMQMVFSINRENFDGKREVVCYTCHRGAIRPASVVAVMQAFPPPRVAAGAAPASVALPTVEQVLEEYVQALGGRAAIEKLTSRVEKGTLEGPGGLRAPYETDLKAPNKALVVFTTPQGTTYQGFNGKTGWVVQPQSKAPRELEGAELARARRDTQFYGDLELQRNYPTMKVAGVEKVGDREAYVVEATPTDDNPEKLYFDAQTGLLVRLVRYNDTPLGPSLLQSDYEDYREVDGIKVPFLIRRARPDFIFQLRWDEIRHNVPLEDSKFEKPAPATP